MKRSFALSLLALAFLVVSARFVWAEEPAKATSEPPKPVQKPDKTGDGIVDNSLADDAKPEDVNKFVRKNRVSINLVWLLITGYLVMFMQAGFALVETGLTRAKNVAHTMAMNFMVYALGMLGFWMVGFGLMFGGVGPLATLGGAGDGLLTREFSIPLFGKDFGLFGLDGFFLTGNAFDVSILGFFLFQMVFMDTTATIPTGAMAERWKFSAFVIYAFFISMIIYPIYGNWVWGGGWLAKLGSNFGLGHGHVDFAGSSVVHMTGGMAALAGALILGPRLGKYNKDGSANVLPAHSVPMYMLGTFILAFGWFGFNPGSSLAGSDLNIARIAVNTMLASAGGAFAAMMYMWLVYGKPDPSFMCNGMLAGLVAITAPCAFVTPSTAVLIGAVAGVLVIWSCLFVERKLKVDDPVGAISVHGVCGAWGILALGLFADGTYGAGWNGSNWAVVNDSLTWFADAAQVPEGATAAGVTGLLYGGSSQFLASCLGVLFNFLWVFPVALAFFWVVEKTTGNRVSPEVELEGLDVPEMGIEGYIHEEPKGPEGERSPVPEPRPAAVPPNGGPRFVVVVEGIDGAALADVWSDLCQPTPAGARPEFSLIYPHMTTIEGTRFRFRGGDPQQVARSLEMLLRACSGKPTLKARIE